MRSRFESLTACLQNRPSLSDTIAHLGLRPPVGLLGSGGVGCCCGQDGGQPDWLLGTSRISRWLVRVTGADAPRVEGVARRDASCCSVRCRQVRHWFLRAVGYAESACSRSCVSACQYRLTSGSTARLVEPEVRPT